MKYLTFLLFFLTATVLHSQTEFGLVAYYSFDNNDDTIIIDQTGNFANNGFSTSNLYDCGVLERSIRLDGVDDKIIFEGAEVKNRFGTEDFTMSFYFKPLNSNQVANQTILSKRNDCSNQNAFAIRYTPATGFINVIVSEEAGFSTIFSVPVDQTHCWHHVILMRSLTTIYLYLDGKEVASDTKGSRIDITSDDLPLVVGETSCSATDGWFEGFFDEFRLYNRSLTPSERADLYLRPDHIQNGFINLNTGKDTVLYLGNSFIPYITNTCADEFQWIPANGVSDPTIVDPVLMPEETTTYTLAFTDNFQCVATDTIRVTVIDPSTLECKPFLPKAFTPNEDGLNDFYGIDNPFALNDFISLEIFDRWGSRMFFTESPFDRWDGSFNGERINPGVFLYKVRYRCGGQEQIDTGSLTIIR